MMNITQRHCGVSVSLAPSTYSFTYYDQFCVDLGRAASDQLYTKIRSALLCCTCEPCCVSGDMHVNMNEAAASVELTTC